MGLSGTYAQGFTRPISRCESGRALSGGCGQESASKPSQVVGRIQ